eukprot:1142854-Pelagomonas_calceolata.AAC.11
MGVQADERGDITTTAPIHPPRKFDVAKPMKEVTLQQLHQYIPPTSSMWPISLNKGQLLTNAHSCTAVQAVLVSRGC